MNGAKEYPKRVRIKIIRGEWTNAKGTIEGEPLINGAYPVLLDCAKKILVHRFQFEYID